MNDKVYKIAPLKWDDVGDKDWPRWTADAGGYYFEKYQGQWKWGYCWSEYYDEDSRYVSSKKEAKSEAEKHYAERISIYLIEVRK